jgi:cytochrome c biogenesis protein CcmG/thiol:disulfide interchange protein DsbE
MKALRFGIPLAAFTLPQLGEAGKQFSPADYRGKVWLLNVWGSWCVSCQVEHPTLIALAKMNVVPIVGFDWKDKSDTAIKWLAQQGGDPYVFSVTDLDGRVAIDYGVYGAPETFVIDKQGVIRHKQIGPLDDKVLTEKLLPLIRRLNQ